MVIKLPKDKEPKAHLIKYIGDENFISSLMKNEKPEFSGHVASIPLNYNELIGETSSSLTICTTDVYMFCPNSGEQGGASCYTNEDGGLHVIYFNVTSCTSYESFANNEITDVDAYTYTGGGNGGGESSLGPGNNNDLGNLTSPTIPLNPYIILINEMGYPYNSSKARWLRNSFNKKESDKITALLVKNKFNDQSTEYVDRLLDAAINGSLVTANPFVQYPEGSNFSTQFPKFTKLLKEELPKVADNVEVIDAINGLTEVPKNIIKEALQWGKGPVIKIEDLGFGGNGVDEKSGVYRGHLNPNEVNSLFIDII